MKIWILESDVNNYEGFREVIDLRVDEWCSFDGRSKAEGWKPMLVEEEEGTQEMGNTPGFFMPIFDKKAVDISKDFLQDKAEILPLEFEGKIDEYYLINVTEVLDCIDYEKSIYERYSEGGRIMCFDNYAFIEEKVKGKHIFKIVDEPLSYCFISDEFRERIINSDLVGFDIRLAWDSESDELIKAPF